MIHLVPESVLVEGVAYFRAFVPDAAPAIGDDVQEELEKLAGSWELVYWLFNGKERSVSDGRSVMSFAGAEIDIRVGERVIERGKTEGLAPGRSPKP
jgi:hypothetical protein